MFNLFKINEKKSQKEENQLDDNNRRIKNLKPGYGSQESSYTKEEEGRNYLCCGVLAHNNSSKL